MLAKAASGLGERAAGLGTGGSTVAGGVTDGGSGSAGTLTPAQISALSPGGSVLAALLGPALAGLIQSNQTSKATDAMQAAITNANNQVNSTLGGANAMFLPYVNAGANAINKAATLGYKPMAGNYAPLESGRGIGMSLGQMAGFKRG